MSDIHSMWQRVGERKVPLFTIQHFIYICKRHISHRMQGGDYTAVQYKSLLQVQISTRSVRPMRGIDNNYPPYGRALIVVWDFNQFWFNSLGFQPGSITILWVFNQVQLQFQVQGLARRNAFRRVKILLFNQLHGGDWSCVLRRLTIRHDNRNNTRDLFTYGSHTSMLAVSYLQVYTSS